MNASPFVTRICLAAAASVFLISAGCSDSSPTSPTPTTSTPPATQPGPAPTTPTTSTSTGAVTVTINPNPVPHSGAAITDAAGCVGVRFTWFYDQVLQETGGSTVTFTNRIDLFDDRETNNLGSEHRRARETDRPRFARAGAARIGPRTVRRRAGPAPMPRVGPFRVLGPRVVLNTP